MKPKSNYIAIDLGAGSGRIMLGSLCGMKLEMNEIHRFEHSIVSVDGFMKWNWDFIKKEISTGLKKACIFVKEENIASISCDSWAQDFGLLDKNGKLIFSPVSYRDGRTTGIPETISTIITPAELHKRNGSSLSPITTLCQLKSMSATMPDILKNAASLLHIADLVHFELCGAGMSDLTIATASQLWNIENDKWDFELLDLLGIPSQFLPEVIRKPEIIGVVRPEKAPHWKLAGVPVISTAGHDTAVATVAIHPIRRGTLFMSLGTWAMLGCCVGEKLERRFLDDVSTVVLGLAWGQWGVFKSGVGMWPLQECVRKWRETGRKISYESLNKVSVTAEIDVTLDLNVPRFFAPKRMMEEIALACCESHQQVPKTPEEFAKVIMQSLANGFQKSVDRLKSATGMMFERIHVVGGGSQSDCLCGLIAKSLDIPVIAGPSEATAIGNILSQARTLGILKNDYEIGAVIENSFPPKIYEARK